MNLLQSRPIAKFTSHPIDNDNLAVVVSLVEFEELAFIIDHKHILIVWIRDNLINEPDFTVKFGEEFDLLASEAVTIKFARIWKHRYSWTPFPTATIFTFPIVVIFY